MAVTYTPMEIGHMQALADKQGITLEEIKKRRALDEEYSTYVDPKLEAAKQERAAVEANRKKVSSDEEGGLQLLEENIGPIMAQMSEV